MSKDFSGHFADQMMSIVVRTYDEVEFLYFTDAIDFSLFSFGWYILLCFHCWYFSTSVPSKLNFEMQLIWLLALNNWLLSLSFVLQLQQTEKGKQEYAAFGHLPQHGKIIYILYMCNILYINCCDVFYIFLHLSIVFPFSKLIVEWMLGWEMWQEIYVQWR